MFFKGWPFESPGVFGQTKDPQAHTRLSELENRAWGYWTSLPGDTYLYLRLRYHRELKEVFQTYNLYEVCLRQVAGYMQPIVKAKKFLLKKKNTYSETWVFLSENKLVSHAYWVDMLSKGENISKQINFCLHYIHCTLGSWHQGGKRYKFS